jgi:hypothetical protein
VSGVKGTQGIALPEIYEIRSLRTIRFSPTTLGSRTAKLAISTGSPAEALDLVFAAGGVATVKAGASGTYTYSTSDDFHALVNIAASGYTISGKLLFYRDKMAVFDGTLQKPGGTAQAAGGVLILN